MEKEATDNSTLSAEIDNWPKVAIIVLNWNGWQDTIEYLKEKTLKEIFVTTYN